MKTILAAASIALIMVTSAHAGVQTNGIWSNGLSQNGLWQNGLWQNGVWQNGVYENGLLLNGRTSTGARPDTFAGSQAIGSANLIAIELPR